jgi:fructose-specific phosphotransferase system IIC component
MEFLKIFLIGFSFMLGVEVALGLCIAIGDIFKEVSKNGRH